MKMAHSEPKKRKVEGNMEDTILVVDDNSSRESSHETADDDSTCSESFTDRNNLAYDEIREEHIVIEGGEGRQKDGEEGESFISDIICESCILNFSGPFCLAFYLCFTCGRYLCEDCFTNHNANHHNVSKESDQNERERIREAFLDELMNESDIEERLETENASVCDRVFVKHELDKDDCSISGLCGLDNRRWAACDRFNSCIKIYQCGSNVLLRYLRIGSKPDDVTEIQVKQKSTVPDSASSSSFDISGTSRTKPDKQCLLAVTLPPVRHILFIDVNKNPAVRVRTIILEKECYRIEYSDDKIFTVCMEDPMVDGSHWSVNIISTDGMKLSVIQTGINPMPDLAVLGRRVYLTDRWSREVRCINVNGKVLSQIKLEGMPRGICVDPDNNVYLSTWSYPGNIYKLALDLDGPSRPLFDSNKVYMELPWAVSFHRDKLFVSHGKFNIISVVRLV